MTTFLLSAIILAVILALGWLAYKLIEWFEQSIEGIDTEGALELFDLEADAGERHNLAKEMPEVVERCRKYFEIAKQ